MPLVLEHGIPYSTVQCVPHPPACSESEVISRICRPNPARPDGETNLSRGEGGLRGGPFDAKWRSRTLHGVPLDKTWDL